MPLLRRHRLRTSLGIVGWMIAGTVAAQAPAATPASAPAVGTAASSSPALRWSPLLNFQRVLDRPDRPQPQHRLAYGGAAQQFGELWLPSPERFGPGPYPVVLLVHGGCWMAELPGPELLAWQAEALREQGLAVWSISYRRVGHEGGGYPGTFKDVALAADHLRELAKNYPLDLSRVTASGHSAGGHLALWLAARPGLPAGSPLHTAAPLPVHGVVSVAGVGDLAWAAPFLGAVCSPDIIAKLVDEKPRGKEAWGDTSPAAMPLLGVPVTMVSGLYDAIVPPAHARRFAQSTGSRGGSSVTLLNLDEAGHFELIAPWTPAGAATVRAILGR
jgi:acetyl esterase/lipase